MSPRVPARSRVNRGRAWMMCTISCGGNRQSVEEKWANFCGKTNLSCPSVPADDAAFCPRARQWREFHSDTMGVFGVAWTS
eukprot:scaffold13_cov241-Pinguiococcus_pyrenoidosus.AAC.26